MIGFLTRLYYSYLQTKNRIGGAEREGQGREGKAKHYKGLKKDSHHQSQVQTKKVRAAPLAQVRSTEMK